MKVVEIIRVGVVVSIACALALVAAGACEDDTSIETTSEKYCSKVEKCTDVSKSTCLDQYDMGFLQNEECQFECARDENCDAWCYCIIECVCEGIEDCVASGDCCDVSDHPSCD